MAAKVTWLSRAADRVQSDLVPRLAAELRATFPEARALAVYDCFGGYSQDQARKIVLGVEVRAPDAYETHVVKLGTREAVAGDYEGWRKCVLSHHFASRIFVALRRTALANGRMAVVYEDAFRLFGALDEAQGPQTLEHVVFGAVRDGKPDPASVERVIRQIYTELHRWFYRAPRADGRAAQQFYARRLRRALDKWADEAWRRDLRRDLIWLLCSHDVPDAFRDVSYLDAYDYVAWALKERKLPQTLVGRSHGDLHGRNVLVGVQRGEAEYPAVFDYGEMDSANVLTWDFVKLECELKVRLLGALY